MPPDKYGGAQAPDLASYAPWGTPGSGSESQFPLLDSYNAFDAAHMVVHQERIDRN